MLLKLIPEIKETHHAAEQLTIPRLLHLKVDVLGAAAKDMNPIKEGVRPPFAYLGFYITLVDRHFWTYLVTQGL